MVDCDLSIAAMFPPIHTLRIPNTMTMRVYTSPVIVGCAFIIAMIDGTFVSTLLMAISRGVVVYFKVSICVSQTARCT